MNFLRKALAAISYVGIGGGPLVAASGVGFPVAAIMSAAGLLAGGVLHFMDSPSKSTQELIELGKQAKALKDAVDAAKAK